MTLLTGYEKNYCKLTVQGETSSTKQVGNTGLEFNILTLEIKYIIRSTSINLISD